MTLPFLLCQYKNLLPQCSSMAVVQGLKLVKRWRIRKVNYLWLKTVLLSAILVSEIFFLLIFSTGHKIMEANLTSACNSNCDCSPNHLEPICGINGITYFSPCHAGCTNYYVNHNNAYHSTVSMTYLPWSKCFFLVGGSR